MRDIRRKTLEVSIAPNKVVLIYTGPEKLSRKLDSEMPFIKFNED